MDGIDEALLPQTILDALLVIRALNIRYLWVDALCILQDSDQDKADQMAIMGDIYRGAYVTIAAGNAHTVEDGFLRIGMIGSWRGGAKTNVIDYAIPNPLFERSWTIQERLLSPRVVVFTWKGLYWQCQSLTDLGQNAERSLSIITPRFPNDVFNSSSACEIDSHDAYRIWHNVLKDYGRSSVSVPTDRLTALSAIARRLSITCGHVLGPYCAGLWYEFIIEGLRWTVEPRKIFRQRPDFRAPSWSWAAINGALFFEPVSPRRLLARCHAYITDGSNFENGEHFVGEQDGEILVEGPMLSDVVVTQVRKYPLGYFMEIQVNDESKIIGSGNLDPGTWPLDWRFHCLVITGQDEPAEAGGFLAKPLQKAPLALKFNSSRNDEEGACAGLLLLRLPDSSKFIRVGCFGGSQAMYNMCTKQRIWIV